MGLLKPLRCLDIGNRLNANLSAILESERILERSYQLFVETDEVFDAYSQTICEKLLVHAAGNRPHGPSV